MMAGTDRRCLGCMEPVAARVCPKCGYVEGTPPASRHFLAPGTVLAGKYLLGRALGAGGFGITYLAWDLELSGRLAIKEYFPNALGVRDADRSTVIASNAETEEAFSHGLERFYEEGRTLARFRDNPVIVLVLSSFRENGTAYLVMKFEQGITLQKFLQERGGRVSFDEAMRVTIPVMDALRAVHAQGILHRDISPDNIIINTDNQVKLLDFGSAKREMAAQDKTLMITLRRGFSPEEQYRSQGPQGPWTDVYALGATLYRAITGIVPPEATERLVNDTLQPPGKLGVPMPGRSEKALMKALAVRAKDRFQTIWDLQTAIVPEAVPEPRRTTEPKPHTEPKPVGEAWFKALLEWFKRNMRAVLLAAGAVVFLALAVVFLRFLLWVPKIERFAGEPAAISQGKPARLSWSVTGGRVSISPDLGPVDKTGARDVSPLATKTYTLTARGALRSVSAQATLTVVPIPKEINFSAEPPGVKPGQSVDLVWAVPGNPAQVTINQGVGVVEAQGRRTVTPTADTVYTLKAEGLGEKSVTVQVSAIPKPVIVSFSADPATIERKQTARLHWSITGDNPTATIDHDIGNVKLQGEMEVHPDATTKYTLYARNAGGPATRSATVEVRSAPPKVTQFEATPVRIIRGEKVTLTWSVAGATDNITIEPGIGNVDAQGSREVHPQSTTPYVIRATGPQGNDSSVATVEVTAPPAPQITFNAIPGAISIGAQAQLQWSVVGAVKSVQIDHGIGTQPRNGSVTVTPQATTEYLLTAQGPVETATATTKVVVSTERFAVVTFTATPPKVKRGKPVRIVWNVTGFVTALTIDPGIGKLGAKSGYRDVFPDQDTTYVLTAHSHDEVLTYKTNVKVTH